MEAGAGLSAWPRKRGQCRLRCSLRDGEQQPVGGIRKSLRSFCSVHRQKVMVTPVADVCTVGTAARRFYEAVLAALGGGPPVLGPPGGSCSERQKLAPSPGTASSLTRCFELFVYVTYQETALT